MAEQLTVEDKLAKHRQTFGQFAPVVFCVSCGSTCVDQNSLTEIRCYDCGNAAYWNARKFSIRRGLTEVGFSDVERAIERET
jgi:predicted RNA-binding Zn-ribbon protein involved in translation (DUF1610 family)